MRESGETGDSREEEDTQWRQVITLYTRILRIFAGSVYVLRQWRIWLIPTYRVGRLYNTNTVSLFRFREPLPNKTQQQNQRKAKHVEKYIAIRQGLCR